jgi:hypothetical protein
VGLLLLGMVGLEALEFGGELLDGD